MPKNGMFLLFSDITGSGSNHCDNLPQLRKRFQQKKPAQGWALTVSGDFPHRRSRRLSLGIRQKATVKKNSELLINSEFLDHLSSHFSPGIFVKDILNIGIKFSSLRLFLSTKVKAMIIRKLLKSGPGWSRTSDQEIMSPLR